MNEVRLLQGDCKDLFSKVKDNSVDLIVTDPPYGVEFSKGFDDSLKYVKENVGFWLREMYRVLKPNCHCYIFIPTKEAGLWISLIQDIFTFNNILSTRAYTGSVYHKNNFQFNNQLVIYCSKGVAKDFNDYDFFKTSFDWLNDKRNKNPKPYTYSYPSFISDCFANIKVTKENMQDKHPCAKNPELLKLFIGISTSRNDIVFDPFMGGGSCGVAAVEMNRQFIGFEKNPNYFESFIEPIENASVWRNTVVRYE